MVAATGDVMQIASTIVALEISGHMERLVDWE
jgi:hypothetical protein